MTTEIVFLEQNCSRLRATEEIAPQPTLTTITLSSLLGSSAWDQVLPLFSLTLYVSLLIPLFTDTRIQLIGIIYIFSIRCLLCEVIIILNRKIW